MMDQRELESRVKALNKSVAANEPPESAIKLLDSLKNDAAPTEEMLRVSGGPTLREFASRVARVLALCALCAAADVIAKLQLRPALRSTRARRSERPNCC